MSVIYNDFIDFPKNIPINITIHSGDFPGRQVHPSTEILFILSGKAHVILEDKTFQVEEEDLFLINSNEIHEIIGSDCRILSIQFLIRNLNFIENSEDLYFDLNSSGETNNERYDYIRHLIARLFIVNTLGENKYVTLSILYAMISHLVDAFSSAAPFQLNASSRYHERVQSILNYIEDHYKESLTLKELAKTQNLSTSYFATFFEKYTGSTFLNYYNEIRLKYAVNEMLSSDLPLETIAFNHGFRDYRSFSSVFRKKYNMLPSKYKKMYQTSHDLVVSKSSSHHPLLSDESEDLKNLAKYLNIYEHYSSIDYSPKELDVLIDGGIVDFWKEGSHLEHTYRNLCCVGSARQFLYADIQKMLTQVQDEIGYKYVKFHGILSDEMMVYNEKPDGTPTYSFALMDKVLDFLRSIHLKPLVQLSFMPRLLAKDPEKLIDMWNFNTSPPKDLEKWTDLIHATISHMMDRYGIEEVRTWLFCVWNEPDGSLDSFGWEDKEEFYRFYDATYKTVKSIDPSLIFGTPSLLLQPKSDQQWAMDFFRFAERNNCQSDFVNIHYYDNSFSSGDGDILDYFSINNIAKPCPLNVDALAFTKFLNEIKQAKHQLKIMDQPVYLTEWNLTISQRDLINDTCFKSCYLTKNLLENYDRIHSFGYWSISDFMEELQIPDAFYHGGLGMFTYNGIPKAHYYTFRFMRNLGDEVLAKGNGYFVTRKDNTIIMILYNYEHFSKLFASGILFDMNDSNRYAPFTRKNTARFQIGFKHLPSDSCLIRETVVNKNQGSSYDAWAKMGSKTTLRNDEIDLLKEISKPGVSIYQDVISDGHLNLSIEMEPLEVRMIEIMMD